MHLGGGGGERVLCPGFSRKSRRKIRDWEKKTATSKGLCSNQREEEGGEKRRTFFRVALDKARALWWRREPKNGKGKHKSSRKRGWTNFPNPKSGSSVISSGKV